MADANLVHEPEQSEAKRGLCSASCLLPAFSPPPSFFFLFPHGIFPIRASLDNPDYTDLPATTVVTYLRNDRISISPSLCPARFQDLGALSLVGMADPLTISASIAGLVTLADVVFSRIFQYVKGVKEASKDISTLSSEVGALYGILNNLRLVACQLEDESFRSTTRAHHLHSCTQTLEKLREILDKDTTSSTQTQRVESIKRKLHWPFKSSEVKSLVAEIERHKATLGLALSADCISGLLQALSLQGSIGDRLDEIKLELRQKHEADTRVAMNEKRKRILKSFERVDPSKNQRMGLKLRQPGTGLWLIDSQEFQDWSQMNGAKLWLYGIPGAGKTILAATVIEEALRTSNTSRAVAFFYCDYKDSGTQEPHLVLGSLIQQIAKQDEQCFEKVQRFCDQRNPEYKDDFGYDTQELRDLFLNVASSFDCTTLIIDGLDECGSKAAEVTELLASLNVMEGDANIKTLFMSRDEVDIREHLEDYSKVAIAARSSDLKLYVAAEIDIRVRKHKLRIRDPSLKAYIMEKLVDGAKGMYVKSPIGFYRTLPVYEYVRASKTLTENVWFKVSLGRLPDGPSMRVAE